MRNVLLRVLPLILLLLAACGRQQPAVTAVVLPQGWEAVDQEGFSFARPPEWEVLSAEDGNVDEAMGELVRENPALGTLADRARASVASGDLKLLAFDLNPEDMLPNFTPNLSIGQQALEQPASLRDVADANERELRASGFADVRRTTMQVAGEDAARLSSTLTLSGAGGESLVLAIEQVVMVRDTQQYVVTFTTAAEQRERLLPVFEQLIGTFRIK
jgi:hypothetical protein